MRHHAPSSLRNLAFSEECGTTHRHRFLPFILIRVKLLPGLNPHDGGNVSRHGAHTPIFRKMMGTGVFGVGFLCRFSAINTQKSSRWGRHLPRLVDLCFSADGGEYLLFSVW